MIPLTGLSFWEEIKKTELGYPRPSHSRILGLVLFCATIGKKYFFVQRQLEREKKKKLSARPCKRAETKAKWLGLGSMSLPGQAGGTSKRHLLYKWGPRSGDT